MNGGLTNRLFSTKPTAGASKNTPYPVLTEVLPSPRGSQAIPIRGAKLLVVFAIAFPNGEFWPLMIIPFSGLKFGFGCTPPSQGTVVGRHRLPFASSVGAFAGLYVGAKKLEF